MSIQGLPDTAMREASKPCRSGILRLLGRRLGLRRFRTNEDGSTAIEFGLVALPFLVLLVAIIETFVIFLASQTLETAVADSARMIMTGQAQTKTLDAGKFKAEVCQRATTMFSCPAGMYVDVRNYSGFSGVDLSKPLDKNGNLIHDFKYEPGGPGDIVVVRVVYPWTVWISLLGFNLSNMAGNQRLLMSTATFRNEPYQ